jgi:hypothetical protein
MIDVFDGDNNLVANIPISEKQLAALDAGAEVAMIFHTPQLLRYVLGERNGSFSLQRQNGRIVTREAEALKAFAQLRADIVKAKMEAGNGDD